MAVPRVPAERVESESGRKTVGYIPRDAQRRIDKRVAKVLEVTGRRAAGPRRHRGRATPR